MRLLNNLKRCAFLFRAFPWVGGYLAQRPTQERALIHLYMKFFIWFLVVISLWEAFMINDARTQRDVAYSQISSDSAKIEGLQNALDDSKKTMDADQTKIANEMAFVNGVAAIEGKIEGFYKETDSILSDYDSLVTRTCLIPPDKNTNFIITYHELTQRVKNVSQQYQDLLTSLSQK